MTWESIIQPATLGPTGLVAVCVLLIFIGRLVPWPTVKRMQGEIDHLRETNATLVKTVALQVQATEAQTQTSEIVKTVMSALQTQAKAGDGTP